MFNYNSYNKSDKLDTFFEQRSYKTYSCEIMEDHGAISRKINSLIEEIKELNYKIEKIDYVYIRVNSIPVMNIIILISYPK